MALPYMSFFSGPSSGSEASGAGGHTFATVSMGIADFKLFSLSPQSRVIFLKSRLHSAARGPLLRRLSLIYTTVRRMRSAPCWNPSLCPIT